MNAPLQLNIPVLYAGNTALITWDSVDGADGYELQRRFDRVFDDDQPGYTWSDIEAAFPTWDDFEAGIPSWDFLEESIPAFNLTIYEGPNTQHIDNISEGAQTAIYRVRSYSDRNITWDELEAKFSDWDDFEANNWTWWAAISDCNTSEQKEIIPNRPPVISGQDENLGTKYRGFVISVSVTDPDPDNTVTLIATLNGTQIFIMANAQQGAPYDITITDAQVFAMADGSTQTITITATDNKGASARRIYTFIAVEDLVTTAIFYVLRDNIPIARLDSIQAWSDYTAAGTHTYLIRGVDRYGNHSDSNSITLTLNLKHPVVALASSPESMADLILRRDERPSISDAHQMQQDGLWFEGRSRPIYPDTEAASMTLDLTYTHTSLGGNAMIGALNNKTVIYRDQYNNRIFGKLRSNNNDYFRRNLGLFDAVVDYSIQIEEEEYTEEIEYG